MPTKANLVCTYYDLLSRAQCFLAMQFGSLRATSYAPWASQTPYVSNEILAAYCFRDEAVSSVLTS